MVDRIQSSIKKEKMSLIQSLITCSLCCKQIDIPIKCTQCENCFCIACIDAWIKKSPSLCPFKCSNPQYQPSRTARELLSQVSLEGNKEILYKDHERKTPNTSSQASFEFEKKYQDILALFNKEKVLNDGLKAEVKDSQFQSKNHSHKLTYNFVNRVPWICNVCRGHYKMNCHGSYYCKQCDFDLCDACRKRESSWLLR